MRFNLRKLGVETAANQAEQYFMQNNIIGPIHWKMNGGSGEGTRNKFSRVENGWKILPRFY